MASRVDRYCAQLAQFATQFMDGTAAEVRAGAGASAKDVADSLDAAISLVKCHAPAGSLDAAVGPAETVRSECWRQLSEGSGWPNVGWREAYGFALMTLALVHVQRHDATSSNTGATRDAAGLREAVKCLDLALIMAGSGAAEVAHTVLADVEPAVAADAGDAEAEETAGDSAKYIIPQHLPAGRAPVMKAECAIPRVAAITLAEFKKRYYKEDRAVILEGSTSDWPAASRWQDLRWFGERTVPVELGKLEGGKKMQGWREEALLMRDLIDEHLVPSNLRFINQTDEPASAEPAADSGPQPTQLLERDVAYLAQHALFDQLPRLRQDLVVPEYTKCGQLEAVNAWLGTAGTITPLHHDSYDNFLTQVVGFKYVRLYEPKETKYLYVAKKGGAKQGWGEGVNAQGNLSPVECECPDLEQYPLFPEAKYREAVLGPGDMLFIPSRHWHYVRSLSPSFSVNFWF